jgi:hypothetical protein
MPRLADRRIQVVDEVRTSDRDTRSGALDSTGRVWKTTLVCAVYVVLSFAFFHQVWRHPTSTMQLGGDQFNFVWYLQSTASALTHLHNPLFSNALNYPYGANLVTDAGVTTLGVLFAPVTWLFGPVASFNAVETLSLATAAIGGYYFALRFVPWRPAAFVCGLLFGFSPYEIAQTGHIHVTFIVLIPLIFLMVHELVVRQSWPVRRAGLVLGLLCVLQFFISSELLFDAVVVGAVAVIVTAYFGRRLIRSKLDYAWRGAAWAAGLSAVLLVYPVLFSVAGPAHIHGPIQLVPQAYRADLLGIVVPDSHLALAPSHYAHIANNYANSATENGSYLGLTLLLILLVGTIALWRLVAVRVIAITGLVAFVFSLGSGLTVNAAPSASINGFPLPERILAELPLLDNAIPARFSLFCALLAGLLLAIVLSQLHDRSTGSLPRASLPFLVAVVALFPLIPAPLAGLSADGVPQYFTTSAVDHIPVGSVAVVYPFPSGTVPNGSLWQAVTGMRFEQPGGDLLVPGANGRIAYSAATGYARDTETAAVLIGMENGQIPARTPALSRALRAELRSWHVRTFLAFPAGTPNPGQAIAFFTWLLGKPPVPSAGGAYAWYGPVP